MHDAHYCLRVDIEQISFAEIVGSGSLRLGLVLVSILGGYELLADAVIMIPTHLLDLHLDASNRWSILAHLHWALSTGCLEGKIARLSLIMTVLSMPPTSHWRLGSESWPSGDLNNDGQVDATDLAQLLGSWGRDIEGQREQSLQRHYADSDQTVSPCNCTSRKK